MGLGSVAVSPLDMASAYATLAAGGVYTEPTAIRRVILRTASPTTAGPRTTAARASFPTASHRS